MARRKRTLPIASLGRLERIAITSNHWPNLEKAFGHALPQSTRDEILKLTASFVEFATFETAAEPLQPARDSVIAWKRAAEALQRALLERSASDALSFARYRVKSRFSDARFQRPHFFEDFSGVLTSFIVACKMALADMDDPELPGHRQGERWENWIRGLTRVLDKDGLPTGARTDDLGEESAFTNLVAELQKFVPAEIQRHTHSLLALAKGVQRARKRGRDKRARDK
jgi:hypothetical protein